MDHEAAVRRRELFCYNNDWLIQDWRMVQTRWWLHLLLKRTAKQKIQYMELVWQWKPLLHPLPDLTVGIKRLLKVCFPLKPNAICPPSVLIHPRSYAWKDQFYKGVDRLINAISVTNVWIHFGNFNAGDGTDWELERSHWGTGWLAKWKAIAFFFRVFVLGAA